MEYCISILIFFIIVLILMPFDSIVSRKNMKKLFVQLNGKEHVKKKEINSLLSWVFSYGEAVYSLLPLKLGKSSYEKLKHNIMLAGFNEKITVEGFAGIRIIICIFCFIYSVLLYLYTVSNLYLFLLIIAPIGSYFYTGAYLNARIKARKWKIWIELPGVLNSLAIITEAGLGFIEAIKKVCDVREGIFISEMKKMLDEVNIGILQKDALFRMASRCDVNDVSIFASTLAQSLQKGASGVTMVLKEQSKEVWEKRKNKAKELGEKASMKLFMPMLLLVFPSLLIFMLGPAILTAIKLFKG